MNETAHRAGAFRGGNHICRPLPVDGRKLPGPAANHCHQVNNLRDVAAGFGQGVGVANIAIANIGGGHRQYAFRARPAHHNPNRMVGFQQALDHLPPQQPGGSGY